MKKIVLLCRPEKPNHALLAQVTALFPDCGIQVVFKEHGETLKRPVSTVSANEAKPVNSQTQRS